MTSVYAVSRGCYSDYAILAVFSTKEQAEQYVAWQNGPEYDGSCSYSEIDIEEWELDVPFTPTGAYVAREAVPPGVLKWYNGPHWHPEEDPASAPVIQWPGQFIKETIVTGYGPTKEHARRSTADMVRAILVGSVVNPHAAEDAALAAERAEHNDVNAGLAEALKDYLADHPE